MTSRPEAGISGDDDRLGVLYATHAAEARRFAYLLCGDEEVAADIAQEAFVRVTGRLGASKRMHSPHIFVRRSATWCECGRDPRRRQARRRTGGAGVPSADQAPTEAIHDVELWSALVELSERQRTALVCRFYLDLSEHDTAAVLSCRPGTVKSLVARGLATLRENWGFDELDG